MSYINQLAVSGAQETMLAAFAADDRPDALGRLAFDRLVKHADGKRITPADDSAFMLILREVGVRSEPNVISYLPVRCGDSTVGILHACYKGTPRLVGTVMDSSFVELCAAASG